MQLNKKKANGAPPIPLPPPAPAGIDLSTRATCLKPEFHSFGNSRKVAGEYIAIKDGMTGQLDDILKKSRIRASKRLLESKELAAITTFDSQVDKYIKSICLPFDFGVHLVPHVAIATLTENLTGFAVERQQLVEAFLAVYPERCQEAAKDLNSQYSPSDYPALSEVRRRFGFSWRYLPFGVPEELKGVSKEIWEQERAKAAERMAEAASEIQLVLREAMQELVDHMAARLVENDGKPVLFFKTTLTNLTEFLGNFDFRNLTDDAELQAVVAKARNLLSGVNLEELRSPGAVRAKIQSGVAALSVQLGALVRTGRKFRHED